MEEKKKDSGSAASVLIGAAFLMGLDRPVPTQTAVFTDKLKAAAFAIWSLSSST